MDSKTVTAIVVIIIIVILGVLLYSYYFNEQAGTEIISNTATGTSSLYTLGENESVGTSTDTTTSSEGEEGPNYK